MRVHDMEVVTVDVEEIRQHPSNANNGDIDAIEESIMVNGFYAPLFVQRSTGYIIAGNSRYAAALGVGLLQLPVIYFDVTDTQALRMMLVDNESARKGFNDESQLAAVLAQLAESEIGLRGSGFEEEDLRKLTRDLDLPLDFDANPVADDRLVRPTKPDARFPFSVTPVISDDGSVYEFVIEKEGMGPLSKGDFAYIHKVVTGRSPSKTDVDAYVVPQWR